MANSPIATVSGTCTSKEELNALCSELHEKLDAPLRSLLPVTPLYAKHP